jgi:hypothetical protein
LTCGTHMSGPSSTSERPISSSSCSIFSPLCEQAWPRPRQARLRCGRARPRREWTRPPHRRALRRRANGGGPTSCAWREHRRRSGEQLQSVDRSYRAPGRSVVPACRALRRRRREGRKPPAPARRGGCAGRPPSALAGREVGEACTSQPRGSSTPPVTPLGELAPASLMATRELRAVAWVAGWLALLLLTRGAGAGGIREGERCRGRGVPLPGGWRWINTRVHVQVRGELEREANLSRWRGQFGLFTFRSSVAWVIWRVT